MRKFLLHIFLVSITIHSLAQNDSVYFRKDRFNKVIAAQSIVYSASMIGLYQLWYKDYDHSSFHFFNDANEWLQMDKIGHFYSSYYINEICYSSFKYSGLSENKNIVTSAVIGLAYITTIEVFDGFSEKWGASLTDFGVDALGIGLFSFQQYYWKEQRIIPKFSFHQTKFPNYRSDALGGNFIQELFKDYNGQTYWISVNLKSFAKQSIIPTWLNIAIGYSADGMLGGVENPVSWDNEVLPYYKRQRQYYLSLDIDLTKIRTKSKWANTVLAAFNSLKIPFPAIEYSNGFKYRPIYF